ncbi:MAG TPA: hypothetical protein VNJ07_06385 [Chitinophagales bacterium]|nr:hypothetical protein [Chitinophagales bacterium]
MRNTLYLMSLALGMPASAFAAETHNLWTTGKIHVVFSVLATILLLIFVFLIVLERKISRLEKKNSE